jgi:isopenicillin N synthase-like dioxygenase
LTSNSQPDLDLHPIADSGEFSESIPVIDIAGIVQDAAGEAGQQAVGEIAKACREWGFFQVINHGVPTELIDQSWQQAHRFFEGPREAKTAIMRTRENPWGYYNNELTKNQRDKKEVFDYTTDGKDPIYAAENRWPDIGDEFRATMREYLGACTQLSLTLLEAFCVGLDLPADFMREDFAGSHTGFMRLNYYPTSDPLAAPDGAELPEADMGVHYHTDAGALTVLLQDDVGGLQVHRDGYWHDVPAVPGAFVINTGDMMQVWSNDIYKAAIHRGLPMSERARYSIPFFFNPAAATEVSPLPTVISDSRPVRYRSINWSEFRGQRTDGDYADYGPEVQIAQYRIQPT